MTRKKTILGRAATTIVRVLFFALVMAAGCWYWKGKLSERHWSGRTAPWFLTQFGVGEGNATGYSDRDAAGDWVARAVSARLLKGSDDPYIEGLDHTPSKLETETLRTLYRVPRAAGYGTSTPITFERCSSPEVQNVAQTVPGWMCFGSSGQSMQLRFRFDSPVHSEEMPRIAVFARPAEAFENTPVFIYWSRDTGQKPFTGKRRSMSTYFRREGNDAFAVLPLARLVEWTRATEIANMRFDLKPRTPQGRLRIAPLPLE